MVKGVVRVIFTLDYEIHGNGEGCPYELMVEPTARLLRLFDAYGAKLTIMADIAEILKFKEYAGQLGKDDYHYKDIAAQLQGAIRSGQWSNLVKNGRANCVAGYLPLFMLLKCLRRLFEKPYFLEGCGLWLGFLTGYLKGIPQVPDRDVIRYLRRQQLTRLLGKPSLWSEPPQVRAFPSCNPPPLHSVNG